MDFCWIYVKNFSAYHKMGIFNELDYSIRSVKKNFMGESRCFVVGDDPELPDAIHVKAPPVVKMDRVTGQPVNLDLLNKLGAIIENPEINEEFILMYDDIFILQPTTKEELMTCYGRAEVINPEAYIRTRNGGRPYKKLWVSTYDYLVSYRLQRGLKTYDWETHLPRYIEKGKMDWLIKSLNLRDIPKIPTSLYSGYYFEDTTLVTPGLQSDIWTHKPGMDFDKEFACKFMNMYDDVIVQDFLNHMYERFGR